MKAKIRAAKKRNPQDATLRNTRAQKALIAALQVQLLAVSYDVSALRDRVTALENPKPSPPQPDGGA